MKDKLDMAEVYIQKLISQPISLFRLSVLSREKPQPLDRIQGAMMLVDGNLDGAISPEELQKVINFVKAQTKNETIETCVWKRLEFHWRVPDRIWRYVIQPHLVGDFNGGAGWLFKVHGSPISMHCACKKI